jgi:electron transfer flavoprotein beta subunit
MTIVACLKWVSRGSEPHDERYAGLSPADESALEFALRQGELLGIEVVAITVGPEGAERVLRDAVACGATRAIRIDAPASTSGFDIAAAIAHQVPGATWVWCGDYSLDRGAGSVPAFIAALLRAQQALGCVSAECGADHVRAIRRLDGGRREVLSLRAPGVISVEGATAPLRRASLAALRAATSAHAPFTTVAASTPVHQMEFVARPYRPRAQALPAPQGGSALERLRVLTDATATAAARGEVIHAEPAEAAQRIVDSLKAWGYLDE